MKGRIAALALCAGLLGTAFVPAARADTWNQRTKVTFSAPVEIPGHILSPGTYVFQVANPSFFPGVIEIFNANQSKSITAVMTIPQYRTTATDHTVITFAERPANAPQAVHSWYYPSMHYGHEFLYQHGNLESGD